MNEDHFRILFYFDTVNKDATYEITIEASYPEVKDFSYNLYVKRGDFDSYSNEGTITNLTDSKVQLLTTTKELDGGVLRDSLYYYSIWL